MRQLLDPRMRTVMPEMWPSRCTIQSVTYTATASNQQVASGISSVLGMDDIECRIAPEIEVRPNDDEIRTSSVESTYLRRQCKLNGYFPSILPREMQALVDGVVYSIRGVEHDSGKFSTRLRLEIIRP